MRPQRRPHTKMHSAQIGTGLWSQNAGLAAFVPLLIDHWHKCTNAIARAAG